MSEIEEVKAALDAAKLRQIEEFKAAMAAAKLRQIDLAHLAGVNYRTAWRWTTGYSPIPDYAWTIIRLQQRVRELTAALV